MSAHNYSANTASAHYVSLHDVAARADGLTLWLYCSILMILSLWFLAVKACPYNVLEQQLTTSSVHSLRRCALS